MIKVVFNYKFYILSMFMGIQLISLSPMAFSQQNKIAADSTAAIKLFITVCNSYKKLPLYVALQHRNSATISVSPADTATFDADFYLTQQGGYMRYGNMEQLVNDSLMLMVSQDQHVMMLNANKKNVSAQLSSYLGFHMADSSALRMANRYAAHFLPAENIETGIIELTNRSPLPGTDIIKEVITLKYDLKSMNPHQVIHVRKTLIPIDKAEWDSLPGHESLNDKLVKIKDNYFLVNERKGIFEFKKISHDSEIVLPVNIADRIIRNEQGEFVKVKAFEHYYLSVD